MKKKIKDLTLEEVSNICESYHWCKYCPLKMGETKERYLCCTEKIKFDKEDLEKEVEIDD